MTRPGIDVERLSQKLLWDLAKKQGSRSGMIMVCGSDLMAFARTVLRAAARIADGERYGHDAAHAIRHAARTRKGT